MTLEQNTILDQIIDLAEDASIITIEEILERTFFRNDFLMAQLQELHEMDFINLTGDSIELI